MIPQQHNPNHRPVLSGYTNIFGIYMEPYSLTFEQVLQWSTEELSKVVQGLTRAANRSVELKCSGGPLDGSTVVIHKDSDWYMVDVPELYNMTHLYAKAYIREYYGDGGQGPRRPFLNYVGIHYLEDRRKLDDIYVDRWV